MSSPVLKRQGALAFRRWIAGSSLDSGPSPCQVPVDGCSFGAALAHLWRSNLPAHRYVYVWSRDVTPLPLPPPNAHHPRGTWHPVPAEAAASSQEHPVPSPSLPRQPGKPGSRAYIWSWGSAVLVHLLLLIQHQGLAEMLLTAAVPLVAGLFSSLVAGASFSNSSGNATYTNPILNAYGADP